jgi:hypothetical protein
MNCYPVESEKHSTPESMLNTEDWLNGIGELDNPSNSQDNYAPDSESKIEHNKFIDNLECPEQQDVIATQTPPGLVWLTQKSKTEDEKVFVTVMQ